MDDRQQKRVEILEIGVTPNYKITNIDDLFPGIEKKKVYTMDAVGDFKPDIVHDITNPTPDDLKNRFDIVVCSHVLEHIPYRESVHVLYNLGMMVRDMGELHIIVPSLEWACQKVIYGQNTPGVTGVFWGGQQDEFDFHKSGYTLNGLRYIMQRLGFVVREAKQTFYWSGFMDVEEIVTQNHVVSLVPKEYLQNPDDMGKK